MSRHGVPVAGLGLLLLLCIGSTALGIVALASGPYTGLHVAPEDHGVAVVSVDRGSPASAAGLRPGDRLRRLGGAGPGELSPAAFVPDPDYLATWSARGEFWAAVARLEPSVQPSRAVAIAYERGGARASGVLSPARMGVARALSRSAPAYLVAWSFAVVALLVLRRRDGEIARVNALASLLICLAFSTLAAYTARDLAFGVGPLRILCALNAFASAAGPYAMLHFALVFPRRKAAVVRWPLLLPTLYAALAVQLVLQHQHVPERAHLTDYLPMSALLSAFVVVMSLGWLRDRDPVRRKQSQWIVFSCVLAVGLWVLATSVPVLFGRPLLSEELSLLPAVVMPVGFAFAVVRYRLMDIDRLVDAALVYTATLAVLEGLELAFLGWVSPRLPSAERAAPQLSVLLVVFAYGPVRSAARRAVQRLFRREQLDVGREVQRFILVLDRRRTALDQFVDFVRERLGAGGVLVVDRAPSGAARATARAGRVPADAAVLLPSFPRLASTIATLGRSVWGYEVIDRGLAPDVTPLRSALLVPFRIRGEVGLVAVLLAKWNGTVYGRQEALLVDALARDVAHLLEAEALRQAAAAVEERHRSEREHVLRELHDGLGALLTEVSVNAQLAARLSERDRDRAALTVRQVAQGAREALEVMRSGLSVLDAPDGALGAILARPRQRALALLGSAGVTGTFEAPPEAASIQVSAREAMHLVRCLQELVSNVARHARAARAVIRLKRGGPGVCLEVEDDGCGFDADRTAPGRGLEHVRRRAQELGGSCAVKAAPGAGTRVTVCFTPGAGPAATPAMTCGGAA